MLQSLISGLLLGGLYSMIGIGMSLVFGIVGLTNLAHGDLMMMSTYITMVFATTLGLPLVVAVMASVVILMIIGYFFQSTLVNRVIDKGAEPPLLVTFGTSIFIANILLKIFGANNQRLDNSLASKNILNTEMVSVSAMYLFSFVVAVVIIVAMHYFMEKTNYGRAIRATSDNVIAAELMGVNTKRTYAASMVIGMGITAIAGALVGSTFVFYPSSGTQYLIIACGVVVIGGMGSLIGTLIGGIVLGVAQLLGAYYFGAGVQMLCAYAVLLIILAVRPDGLFAVSATRK